eukprot:1124814-Amphidinium_carterae.1
MTQSEEISIRKTLFEQDCGRQTSLHPPRSRRRAPQHGCARHPDAHDRQPSTRSVVWVTPAHNPAEVDEWEKGYEDASKDPAPNPTYPYHSARQFDDALPEPAPQPP